MKQRLTRAESQAVTRARLLKSATRVFLKHGYAGATVDLVAEEAGYSKGAVYSNFAGKEAIFLVLLREKLTSDIENITGLARAETDIGKLLTALRAYLEAREEVLDFTSVIVEFLTSGELTAAGARECAALYQQQREAIAELMETMFARAGARPPVSPKEVAMNLIALVLELAAQRAIDRAAVPVTRWSRQIDGYLRVIFEIPGSPLAHTNERSAN